MQIKEKPASDFGCSLFSPCIYICASDGVIIQNDITREREREREREKERQREATDRENTSSCGFNTAAAHLKPKGADERRRFFGVVWAAYVARQWKYIFGGCSARCPFAKSSQRTKLLPVSIYQAPDPTCIMGTANPL